MQSLVKTWHRQISDLVAAECIKFHTEHPDIYMGWRLTVEAGDGQGQHMQSTTQSRALLSKYAEHQWTEVEG